MRHIQLCSAVFLVTVVLGSFPAHGARILNISEGSITGTTIEVLGNLVDFPDGTGTKYSANSTSGTSAFATINATPPNTDFFWNLPGTELTGLNVDTAVYRYAEIDFTLSDDFVGDPSTHALRLDTDEQPAAFVDFLNRGVISSTAGNHTFVIDLQTSTDLDAGTGGAQYSGNLTTMRWDFFNGVSGNEGKTFTLNSVTFADSVTAIPEPSFALFGLVGLGGLLSRRQIRRR
ncbi:MAG: hypothetical protein AAGC97_19485 [Planctomycetota bacterium]